MRAVGPFALSKQEVHPRLGDDYLLTLHLDVKVHGRTLSQRKGRLAEADAPLDNERPTTTYLSVTVSPDRHWFPPWNRRSPVLRGRGFSMARKTAMHSHFV
jgi:hypothetical protein